MIYVVGTAPQSSKYEFSTLELFLIWFRNQLEYQLDIETTMTDWWCDKEIITIQFGSIDMQTQWVIHWDSLNDEEKEIVRNCLRDATKKKLIHNGMFEYVVLRFHGVILNNIYDSMLAEQVLNGGQKMSKGYYALGGNYDKQGFYTPGLAMRYLCLDMDKSQQTTFSHEPLTEEQVIYAAEDARIISPIRRMQVEALKVNMWSMPLENVAALEMEALCTYGDMTYEGMELDAHDWLANLDLVEPVIQQAEADCIHQMQTDPKLYAKAVQLGYINIEDISLINWGSAQAKIALVQMLDPDLNGTSVAFLKGEIKRKHPNSDILQLFVDKDFQAIGEYFYEHHRPEMIEKNLIRPAGDIQINWNSVDQVLPLLKAIDSKMRSMDEQAMNKFSHPIGKRIKEYKDTLKLRTTYGEEFVSKYTEPDGKVRTSFNQVVSTGRTSSSKPNMQNIPAKETVGNRYRNPFKAPPGHSYVSGDYTGQELCVIAYLSKDEVWTDAIRNKQDLHSICAEMVWPEKWKAATEPGCAYYQLGADGKPAKLKCKCKKHGFIRYDTKAIDFG